jgi:hypothetical protein
MFIIGFLFCDGGFDKEIMEFFVFVFLRSLLDQGLEIEHGAEIRKLSFIRYSLIAVFLRAFGAFGFFHVDSFMMALFPVFY